MYTTLRKDVKALERVQKRFTRMGTRMRVFSYGVRLEKLGQFALERIERTFDIYNHERPRQSKAINIVRRVKNEMSI